MKENLVFATGNRQKQAEIEQLMGTSIKIQQIPNLHEIQPDQAVSLDDLRFVAKHKAEEAFRQTGSPIITEDVGVFVEAWGGRPGPLIKQFGGDTESRQIMCDIATRAGNNRMFVACIYGSHDGQTTQLREGVVYGVITEKPRGLEQFAWDTIFIPNGQEELEIWDGIPRTYAELYQIDPKYKHQLSMRRLALEEIKKNPFNNGR